MSIITAIKQSAAPPKSWVAFDDQETEILAFAPSLHELETKIQVEGLRDVVIWKLPPAKGRPAF